ncbi:hypothetical protein RB195_025694 [Necator americanus]|uniref:Sema domain-containing protein n=1 Tax=Necator americanus TaxID=51031 RepID=A0ABR1ETM4_NECAM
MMQVRKLRYDVIRLTKKRRRHPLNAVYGTGGELLLLGTCDDSRRVGVLVNTSMAKNIDTLEQLPTRIGHPRMRRCGPTPAWTVFVAYIQTSSYEEDHTFYKVIIDDFTIDPRRTPEELHIGSHGLQ